jgi:hypothetical protein
VIDPSVDSVECDIADRPIWQNAKILRVDTVCLQLQMNNANEEAVAQTKPFNDKRTNRRFKFTVVFAVMLIENGAKTEGF